MCNYHSTITWSADYGDKLPPVSDLVCGYFHKGSKCWIESDQDLEAMYKLYAEITVWCEGHLSSEPPARCGRKRKAEEPEPSTKADKIDELAHELYKKMRRSVQHVSGQECCSISNIRVWKRHLHTH